MRGREEVRGEVATFFNFYCNGILCIRVSCRHNALGSRRALFENERRAFIIAVVDSLLHTRWSAGLPGCLMDEQQSSWAAIDTMSDYFERCQGPL